MKRRLVKILTMITLGAALLGAFAIPALADSTDNQGQPDQSCEEQLASPPGFGTGGFATAESVYAGSQTPNSKNPNSVAQYDVACFQVSQPHP